MWWDNLNLSKIDAAKAKIAQYQAESQAAAVYYQTGEIWPQASIDNVAIGIWNTGQREQWQTAVWAGAGLVAAVGLVAAAPALIAASQAVSGAASSATSAVSGAIADATSGVLGTSAAGTLGDAVADATIAKAASYVPGVKSAVDFISDPAGAIQSEAERLPGNVVNEIAKNIRDLPENPARPANAEVALAGVQSPSRSAQAPSAAPAIPPDAADFKLWWALGAAVVLGVIL